MTQLTIFPPSETKTRFRDEIIMVTFFVRAVLGNFTSVKPRLVVNDAVPWITTVFGYR